MDQKVPAVSFRSCRREGKKQQESGKQIFPAVQQQPSSTSRSSPAGVAEQNIFVPPGLHFSIRLYIPTPPTYHP